MKYISKTILFILLLSVAAYGVIISLADKREKVPVQVYVVDSELMRLIPIGDEIIGGDTASMAREALNRLIDGYDKNRKIRRIIPDDRRCLSVCVSGKTACVNINSSRFDSAVLTNRDVEKLFIYQVVNTLTSIDGIKSVRFTVDGMTVKRFAGFVDMRETFEPENLL